MKIHHQQGSATLVMSLLLLFLMTAVGLFSTKVGVNEYRTSANYRRSTEAFQRAEAGLERAVAYFEQNRKYVGLPATDVNGDPNVDSWFDATTPLWTQCADDDTALPCGDGSANIHGPGWVYRNFEPSEDTTVSGPAVYGENEVFFLAECEDIPCAGELKNDNEDEDHTVYLYSTGFSDVPADSRRGEAIVVRAVSIYLRTGSGPGVPLISDGAINLGGTFTAIPNPNAGGPGVPISAWSSADIDLSNATAQTCHEHEYLSQGTPTKVTLSNGGSVEVCDNCSCPGSNDATWELLSEGGQDDGIDILDVDSNIGNPDSTYFPADLLAYVFGVASVDWLELYYQATIVNTCDDIDDTSSGLYWVEAGDGGDGDCTISDSNAQLGAPDNPVAIVVDEGDISMNGGSVFGLVFSFDNPDKAGAGGDVSLNGNPIFYGSIVIDHYVNLSNGNFTVRYEADILENLNSDVGKSAASTPGGWIDFYEG